MHLFTRVASAFMVAALAFTGMSTGAFAQAKPKCTIAWSHYTGWEFFDALKSEGILKKWGDRHGVILDVTAPMDYVESINQYAAKQFCGVAITNMDALTIPATGGVKSTFIVVGDYSNGNDGILIKSPKPATVNDLKGKKIALVENTVSHYLLARALEKNGLSLKDVTTVNASDSDIGNVFQAGKDGQVVITWNPILMTARNVKGAQLLFDSSKIPGEIIDGIIVHSDTPEAVKKAVVGAWFEVMGMMQKERAEYPKLIKKLAASAGGTEQEFVAQLKTTALFLTPQEAAKFTGDAQLKKTMDDIRKFSFSNGLFGDAKNIDQIGIKFSDGSTLGDAKNIMLEFDTSIMKLAADGKL